MIKKDMTLEEEIEKINADQATAEQDISSVEKKISFYKNSAWILIGLGFLIGIIGFVIHYNGLNWNLNLFGDYIGGVVASTWSLAGLFIIYVAFLGQRIQLIQQKIELRYNQFEVRATREELKAQKEQMVEQNKTLSQQRFENTFFQMLNLHHQIVNSIDVGTATSYKSRDSFKRIYELIKTEMRTKSKDNLDIILQRYLVYYNKYQSDLGHYFRNLYTIIKLVKFSEIEDKHKYTNIVRAQLSSHELLLLFYNCLSRNGIEKFKTLIEEFHLLKNMPSSIIANNFRQYYKAGAFGKPICPVCNSSAQVDYSNISKKKVDCTKCGKFIISNNTFNDVPNEVYPDWRIKLQEYIQMNQTDSFLLIDDQQMKIIFGF